MVKTPKQLPADVETLVQELAQLGLSQFLRDTDMSGRIAREISNSTGIKLLYVRLSLRLITPVITNLAEAGGKWLGALTLQRLKSLLERSDFCYHTLKALKTLAEKTTKENTAEGNLKTYLSNLQKTQNIEGADALSIEVQSSLGTMALLEAVAAELQLKIEALQDLVRPFLNPQPVFKDLLDTSDRTRFVYRSRYIPFSGRAAIMENLQRFLLATKDEKPAMFLWQAVTAAGGAGKSRLALELCLANGGAFRAGILRNLDHNYTIWQPDMPCLLVVDYASADRERLKAVLQTLADRTRTLEYPVRVLLLDRDSADSFFSELAQDDDISRYQFCPTHNLPALDENDLWGIILHFLEQGNAGVSDSREQHLQGLKKIDSKMRPLFAAYYGDAVARGHCRTRCDRKSLLRNVIEREKEKFWRPQGITPSDTALVALATMTRGITARMVVPSGVTPIQALLDQPKRFRAMCGRVIPAHQPGTAPLQVIPPWEPDLVGELFVLEYLKPDPDTGANPLRATLIQAAWSLRPLGMVNFLNLAVHDYPEEAWKAGVHTPPEGTEPQQHLWCMLAVNMIGYWGHARLLEQASQVYADLCALVALSPDDVTLAEIQANAAFNMVNVLREANAWDKAQTMYIDLADLTRAWQGNATIAKRQCSAAVNLIASYSTAQKWLEARSCYTDLVALAKAWPNSYEIALEQVEAAFCLVACYAQAKQWNEATICYAELAALAKAWPNSHEMALEQAKSAVNLGAAFCTAQKWNEALLVHEDLDALAVVWANDEGVANQKAMGTFNLLINYASAKKFDKATAYYAILTALTKEYPNSSEIAFQQATGALALARAIQPPHGPGNEIGLIDKLHGDIDQLARSHKTVAEFIKRYYFAQSQKH